MGSVSPRPPPPVPAPSPSGLRQVRVACTEHQQWSLGGPPSLNPLVDCGRVSVLAKPKKPFISGDTEGLWLSLGLG